MASMQPEFPGSKGVEQLPSAHIDGDIRSYDYSPRNHEFIGETGSHEDIEQRREASSYERYKPVPFPVAQNQVAGQPVSQQNTQIVQVADNSTTMKYPISANDDDDIEREWVDRAKQLIVQTRDDPRAREKALDALRRDYLEKRYGKKLGATSD